MLQKMQLMPIGRFSRLTGVGVKALRHYDEVGLLVPAAVSPRNSAGAAFENGTERIGGRQMFGRAAHEPVDCHGAALVYN